MIGSLTVVDLTNGFIVVPTGVERGVSAGVWGLGVRLPISQP